MKMTIMGLGVSGISAFHYLTEKGVEVNIIDAKEEKFWPAEILEKSTKTQRFVEGELKELSATDLVILSPGIAREHRLLKKIDPSKIISEVELALLHTQIPVIAITGTNGKTTTTTLMGMALKKAGRKAFVGGNIGVPVVEALRSKEAYDFLVLELSSFQLESTPSLHPLVSVILNVSDNHGERYQKFSDYKKAKLNILNHQGMSDLAILAPELDAEKEGIQKVLLHEEEVEKTIGQFDFSKSNLLGKHNRENLFVVYKTLLFLNIPEADRILQELINEFKGVAYRLQFIGSGKGALFYNDAKSTNTASTVTALKAVAELQKPVTLILGGKLRQEKVDILNDLLPFQKEIAKIFLIGEASSLLEVELKKHFEIERAETLENVFKNSLQEIVVFSPAFPSFDQFKNYEERGELFSRLTLDYLKS